MFGAVCCTADNNAGVDSSAVSAVLTGVLAMTLIVIVTVALPKIAAFVDRLLGRQGTKPPAPSPERVEENYKVYDIYEGELNLDDNENDIKE